MPSRQDGTSQYACPSPAADRPRPIAPPSRLSRILWGTALQARPSLQGLLVVPKAGEPGSSPGELFSWQRVHTYGDYGFWSVLDEDGRPLKRDHRPVCLQVKGWRTKRLARQLQKRHIRHAWDDGTLSVTADLSRDLPPRWPVVVLALFFGAALTMMFWSIWLKPPSPPFWQAVSPALLRLDGRLLMWLLWASFVLAAALFCGAFWRYAVKVNTTWVRFTREGVTATLKDGSTVLQSWDSLTSIGRSFTSRVLAFGTSSILRLEPGRCAGILRPVLDMISENVLKKPAGHEGELTRAEIIRIGIYCLVGCVAGGLLVLTLPPEAPRIPALEAFGMLAFCLGAIWAVLAATVFLSPTLAKRCSRWLRRRRSAGLNASSSGR